ncbi:MAG: glycosyltransferase family 39 protein, partial [Candidatus Omnitrophica bacterium]|nr:glycosyltransferase family 39 protein [Candidatus Omnitrophota bacterium]
MSTESLKNSWLRDPTTRLRRQDGWWGDPWLWGLALAAGGLLLTHLSSSGLLWQDEAETAVLAKNILRFGYPKVSDGINRINPGLAMGPYGAWAYHPWLQFYITALSFIFFGATTVAARFPFALAGIFCILLSYRLARMIFHSIWAARIFGLLMLTSVPLLLHFRQCRYYALATLATGGALAAYFKAREGHRRGWDWLAVWLVVLFHSHHGAFLPTAVALMLDIWKQGIPKPDRKRALWALTAAM